METFALAAAASLAIGLVVGLTGVGGGSLMTPLLMVGFGVPAPMAVGTDLACAAFTKSAGTVAHRVRGNVVTRVVLLMAAGSLPAALATLWALDALQPSTVAFDRLVRSAVAVALLVAIAVLLSRSWLRRIAAAAPEGGALRRWRGALTVACGIAIGVAVTLSSLGAGAIGAALLALLYPELEPVEIAGSDIAHAVPLTALAAAGHGWLGHIDGALLLALLAGATPGIIAGSLAARRLPSNGLRALLIATLAFAAYKIVA